MNRIYAYLIMLGCLFLAACIPEAATEPGQTPLTETLEPQGITPTASAAPTQTAAVTANITTTITPTQTAAPTPAPLQFSPWTWIKMFDLERGWAVDPDGALFRLGAELEGWQEVTPPEAQVTTQVLTWFMDPQRAWLVYQGEPIPLGGPWDVWRTADGGQSWQRAGALPSVQEGMVLVEIFFVDAEHGWVLGQIFPGMHQVFAVLYATSDGGDSWQIVSNPLPSGNAGDTNLPGSYSLPFGNQPIVFISPQTGFTGGDSLYKTEDGGFTWQPQLIAQPEGIPALEQPFVYISPPRFFDASTGVFQYLVFDFMNVFCPPCDVFTAPPAAAFLYFTEDGGQTWSPRPAPAPLGMAGLVNANTAWFLARAEASQATTTLYLSEGPGETWMVRAPDTIFPLGARLYFTGESTGFAYNPFAGRGFEMFVNEEITNLAGIESYFYFTEDGGGTWAPFPPAYP